MPSAPKRRWFRFGLRAWLVAAALIPIIVWQCATWPISETVHPAMDIYQTNGMQVQAWLGPYEYARRPSAGEFATRMLVASAVIGGAIALIAVVRSFLNPTR